MRKIKTKDIGKHIIGSDGSVWSKAKKRLMSGSIDKEGYSYIRVNSKWISIHRQVYKCFVGEIPPGMQVDHLNGKRLDNRLVNLECVTPKENVKRAIARNGGVAFRKQGEKHGRSILDDMKVLTILTFPKSKIGQKSGWTYKRIADIYGVSRNRVGNIRNGREWKHLQ